MDKEMIRDYELDIIVKSWRDEPFRQKLLKDPKKAIEDEFGIKVPADTEIFVHVESDKSLHLIVPSVPSNFHADDLSDDELKDVIGGVISTGHLAVFPAAKDRTKVRVYKLEIEQLKKMNEKLKDDLSQLEKQILKS